MFFSYVLFLTEIKCTQSSFPSPCSALFDGLGKYTALI